jgi:hypothetical protein
MRLPASQNNVPGAKEQKLAVSGGSQAVMASFAGGWFQVCFCKRF